MSDFILDPELAMPGRLQERAHELATVASGRYLARNEMAAAGLDDLAAIHQEYGDRFLLRAYALAEEWSA